MDIVKKIRTELLKNGPRAVLMKGWIRICRFFYYSTSSIWFERNLDHPTPALTGEPDVHAVFLISNKEELTEWLHDRKNQFSWIYYQKEIDCAQKNNHIYLTLKCKKEIIGFVKVGVGSVYIHDFDKVIVFDPGTAFIYDTFILPEYRGSKLALFALREVIRYLQKREYHKIMCHIEKWNIPSIKTFQQAGFYQRESIRFTRIAGASFYVGNTFTPFLNLQKRIKT